MAADVAHVFEDDLGGRAALVVQARHEVWEERKGWIGFMGLGLETLVKEAEGILDSEGAKRGRWL